MTEKNVCMKTRANLMRQEITLNVQKLLRRNELFVLARKIPRKELLFFYRLMNCFRT